MKRGFGMIAALLFFITVFCVSGTASSREKKGCAQENERYEQFEDAFKERACEMLEERGYHDSGLTVTWTREQGGRRSYRVQVHHRRIMELGAGEQAQLTETLLCEDFCKEVEDLHIIYY